MLEVVVFSTIAVAALVFAAYKHIQNQKLKHENYQLRRVVDGLAQLRQRHKEFEIRLASYATL